MRELSPKLREAVATEKEAADAQETGGVWGALGVDAIGGGRRRVATAVYQ